MPQSTCACLDYAPGGDPVALTRSKPGVNGPEALADDATLFVDVERSVDASAWRYVLELFDRRTGGTITTPGARRMLVAQVDFARLPQSRDELAFRCTTQNFGVNRLDTPFPDNR